MSKSSQKQTKHSGPVKTSSVSARSAKNGQFISPSKVWSSKATENKFEGISEHLEVVTPVIIPGYKLRG